MSISYKINIGSIESYLESVFSGRVCEDIYFDSAPKTRSNSKPFMVISLPRQGEDFNYFGNMFCMVEVYSKELASGIKNRAELNELETKLMSIIDEMDLEQYCGSCPYIICKTRYLSQQDYNPQRGYFIYRTSFIVKIL